MWWTLLFVLVNVWFSQAEVTIENYEVTSYEIAGIFDAKALVQRLAFAESMRHVNLQNGKLEPIVLYPDKSDSFSVYKAPEDPLKDCLKRLSTKMEMMNHHVKKQINIVKTIQKDVCSNDTMRPIAVFGPQHPVTDVIVREQCNIANIPFIQATWLPMEPDPLTIDVIENEPQEENPENNTANADEFVFKDISINFYPDSNEIAIAYSKLLKYYDWKNFAVLYEDDFGLLRVQKILAEHTEQYPVVMLKLDPNGNNKQIFKTLSKYQDVFRVLIDCHVDRVEKYMNDAKEVKMADMYKHFIIVSLDATILTDVLLQFQSNTTWLSITDYDELKSAQHFLAGRVAKWKSEILTSESPPVTDFQTEALIMDDIARHVIKAVNLVEDIKSPRYSICSTNNDFWRNGARLQHKILTTKSLGVTGNVEFDENGKRINYQLFVNEVHVQERKTIGKWQSAQPDSIIEERAETDKLGKQFNTKHFIVISKRAKPYFYEKECIGEDENCDKEEYEGFSVDLVDEIFKYLREQNFNFTYEFKILEDLSYGAYDNKTKKWSGLIGHLLNKEADLAVCDITITKERKKVVDFSVPFMNLGISILYLKEKKKAPGMFSFMYPYTFEVWLNTATAYCVVSIIMFFCSRLSPADWENPQPCDKDPEELENIWNFKNCTWLTMGSIMTQGCDILPKAIGSRWVCGMWWFFAVIVCQTYIAQLSASMTSALETLPINNVEELANQNKILYGAIDPGSTLEFFRTSKDKMYRKIYENMKANPAVLVKSNDEGEKRVLKGQNRYAFFMESTTIEYKLKRNCDLKQVGKELDSKDYGIAMPANSPFRSLINRAILQLRERAALEMIKNKWWEEKYGAEDCPVETDDSGVEGDLELENLMGAFIVLVVGLVFCLFITAAEFTYEVHNIVVREGVSFKEVFVKELKSSLNVFQLQKPVLRNLSRAPSVTSSREEIRQERRAAAIANFLDFEKEIM